MRKRDGSILIEVMASIVMLSFAGIFIVSVCMKCLREYENRIREDKLNMAVNMLIKEIKFNINQQELEEMFYSSDYIGIKYDDDLCQKISCTDIRNLENGADIEIQKIAENNIRSNYKILVSIEEENFTVEREYEFYKSWWMDEI